MIESKQNKAQCNLDRQTAKILALSSGDVSKFEFLKIFLPERGLLQKETTVRRFEYSPLGS